MGTDSRIYKIRKIRWELFCIEQDLSQRGIRGGRRKFLRSELEKKQKQLKHLESQSFPRAPDCPDMDAYGEWDRRRELAHLYRQEEAHIAKIRALYEERLKARSVPDFQRKIDNAIAEARLDLEDVKERIRLHGKLDWDPEQIRPS